MPGRRKREDSPHREAAAALARNIKSTRTRRGWSQQKLAEKAAIAYGTVRAIETGAVLEPGIFTVRAIAGVLDVTLEDLLEER